MKSRIATLEGEAKKSKPTHDALSKHIKMLELALRKEREKVKSLSKGEEVDMKDAKELAREQLKAASKGVLIALIRKRHCSDQKETLLIHLRFTSG